MTFASDAALAALKNLPDAETPFPAAPGTGPSLVRLSSVADVLDLQFPALERRAMALGIDLPARRVDGQDRPFIALADLPALVAPEAVEAVKRAVEGGDKLLQTLSTDWLEACDVGDLLGYRLGSATARLRGVAWRPAGGSVGRAFARAAVRGLKQLLDAEARIEDVAEDWFPAAEHVEFIQGIVTNGGMFLSLDEAEDRALAPRDEQGRPISREQRQAAREMIAAHRLPLTGIRFSRSVNVGRFRTNSGPIRFNGWDAFRLHGVLIHPAREAEYLERLAAALASIAPPEPRARPKARATATA